MATEIAPIQTEIAPAQTTTAVAAHSPLAEMSIFNINPAELKLEEKDNIVQEVELAGKYWTPEEKGESKIVVFMGVSVREIFDEETGELTDKLATVKFAALENGSVTQIMNASKRLAGIFNDPIYTPGMKFKVTYVGKKKSTQTGHNYDDWSVKPVITK